MMKGAKIAAVLAVSVATFMGALQKPAAAITVELAKKCRAMMLKAHPYKLPGVQGPGTAAAERDYYNQCIARGGNMPDDSSSGGKSGNKSGNQSGSSQLPAPPPAKQ